MARANSINLIPTNIENTPEIAGVYDLTRKIGIGGVIALIISGLVVGGLYFYLSGRVQTLTTERDTLTETIRQQSVEEGLLLTARQRIAVLDKLLADQKNIGTLFTLVAEVVPVGSLSSIDMDESNKVSMVVHIQTLEEAITVGDALVAHAVSNTLTKPALDQLTIPKEGGFQLAISFVPKL